MPERNYQNDPQRYEVNDFCGTCQYSIQIYQSLGNGRGYRCAKCDERFKEFETASANRQFSFSPWLSVLLLSLPGMWSEHFRMRWGWWRSLRKRRPRRPTRGIIAKAQWVEKCPSTITHLTFYLFFPCWEVKERRIPTTRHE